MNKQLPQVSIVLIPVLLCCFLLPGLLRANKGTPSQAGMTWADKQDVAFNWREISSASALGTPPDNDTVYTATLPFTFYYYNQPFTTLYISSNGMISFHFYGGRSFPTNDNLAFNGGPDSLLAVFWDNLEVVATSNYNLYTKVEGTAPYRRFIVEYLGFQRDSNNLGPLTFQVIFFETTNLIKFQYLELQEVGLGGLGSKATIGLKYSGQGTFKDSLLYSFQQNVLSDSLAILFYPAGNLSASASINPVTIQAGTNFQQFTYRITNLTSTADSLKRMGKADVVRLANFDPSTTMLVTGVKVDGHSFFIKNENSVPTEPGFATWYYDTVKDSLYINFPSATVVDSVSITYLQTVSTTPATHTVNGHIFNRLHPAMAASVSASFTVTAASVARYSISPSRDTTTVAGSGLAFTLNAFDAFDNPVPNSGSAVLVAQGSGTALFSPNDTLSFAGGSSVGFTVSDTVAGSFTIRASAVGDSTVNGVSGVVTVQNGPISRLTILSSQGNLVVGSHRLLQVELRDRYGNIVADSLVTFTRLSGDGQFSNGLGVITVTSSSAGVAQAEWTGSTQTGFVSDSIQVRAGSVQDTIVMPLVAGSVSHYSFVPAGDRSTLAGSSVSYTLEARDLFDNPVPNSGSAVLVAQGSGTALFSPNDTLSFAGGSSVGFTVSDTVAGSFTIRASAVGDSTVNGVSGVVTVQNGPISRLTILSSQGNLVVGSHRLLQVELRDRYGNIVADSLVTFTRLSGDGQFSNGLGVITVTSSSAGVAQAEWTGSTQTGFVSDSIQVRAGSVQDTIVMPLVAGSVSHYDFTPATAQTTTAGTVLNYILTARDLFGNSTPNTDRVALSALNGTGVTFSTDTLDFAGNATVAFTIQDTVAETFFVKAEKVGNAAISGQSAAITVNPGAASNLTEVGGSGSVAVGSEVTLKAVLKDAFGNLLSDSSVVFKRLSGGNGTFKTNGLDSITVSTGSDGIAQVVFVTSSSTSFGTDSVLAYFGTTDSVVFVLNLLPGEVSYLSIQPSPTVFSYNAGDTISLLVKAFDVFGNLVTSSTRKVTLSASSGNVQLLSTNPATLAAGQHTFTVRDTVAESGVTFTVTDTTGKSATTAAFTINPSSLSRLIIRGAANNSGQVFSGKDTTLTADQALQLFAAGYDRFGNFIADIDSAGWTSTGQLSPAVNSTGKSVSFAPARSGVSGRIRVQISGNATVASDSTGLIQVTSGALASVRIQLSPDSGGTELADRTLVAGDTLTLYAAGYDADFNFLGLQSASWKVSPGKIGKWVGGDTTFTGTTARLVADTAGNGTVSIAAIANSFLTDVSGVLTVTVGPADHIVLRNQANNGGQRYDALALILSTDTTLLIYAAHSPGASVRRQAIQFLPGAKASLRLCPPVPRTR